jgi:hypothetical protein
MDKSKLVGAINMMKKLDLFSSIRILSINNEHINPTMVENIIQSSPNLREIKFSNVRVTEKMAKLLVSHCPTLEQVYMEGGRTDDVSKRNDHITTTTHSPLHTLLYHINIHSCTLILVRNALNSCQMEQLNSDPSTYTKYKTSPQLAFAT